MERSKEIHMSYYKHDDKDHFGLIVGIIGLLPIVILAVGSVLSGQWSIK